MIVLSGTQAGVILSAREKGLEEGGISLDLGRDEGTFKFSGGDVVFPDGQRLTLELVGKMDDRHCFLVKDGQLFKIQFFSEDTKRLYELVPTDSAPTFTISGIRMHQTKDYNPLEDAKMKVKVLKPMTGRSVLDTCTGLGYSAIESLKAGAKKVVTVEADSNVVELAKVNPWSRELWADGRVERVEGDVAEVISGFKDSAFDRIIHDPPRLGMAGELYGRKFYINLFRVLKPGGILFHYVGRPGSRFRNRRVKKGVIERLREAGFTNVKTIEELAGVKAVKIK
ncbi:MAG: methyltransferase domain-containing protein [Candidatus Altiarchaeota archaeon]|nr:methyltransferase domain-containing protein [Candidatus Altiarchaeota archaeon]